MLSEEEKKAIEYIKNILNYKKLYGHDGIETNFLRPIDKQKINILLNLIEKQKNIIDSTKRILEDEELDYCDTLDEIYHFYEEVVNNDR